MKSMEDILTLIEEEDVEFIRLQFSDAFGNLKNIAVTPGQLDRVMAHQYSVNGAALFDDLCDFEEELYLYPDLDTFVILPWRPQHGKVAKIICDLYDENGVPFDQSPRAILQKVIRRGKEEGYTFIVNPECEFFLFHTDDNGNPTTISHERAGYLDVGPLDYGENARRELVLMLEEMGFEIASSHHEKASAQHQIDFMQGEAMETADALMNFKFAVRSIAKRFGLYATFMPKPKTDEPGSGMHLNISMYKDGKNLFEPQEKKGVTDAARHFIGGIMEHAEGMCAITNPIVNSYKRILTGFGMNPTLRWSQKNDKSMIKLRRSFGDTKVEIRFPDPAANPYLAMAVCIAAGLDGVKRGLEPDGQGTHSKKLPENLKDAIRMMKKDKYICEVLGDEFSHTYIDIKKQEWNEYMMQVSDWEVSRYLRKM